MKCETCGYEMQSDICNEPSCPWKGKSRADIKTFKSKIPLCESCQGNLVYFARDNWICHRVGCSNYEHPIEIKHGQYENIKIPTCKTCFTIMCKVTNIPHNNTWMCIRSTCREYEKHISLPEGIGLDPNQPTVINDQGGKQSKQSYRCDLLPPAAMLAMAKIFNTGSIRYDDDPFSWDRNWHKIHWRDHMNRSLSHIFAFLLQDDSDDHFEHAMCRLTMSYEMYKKNAV